MIQTTTYVVLQCDGCQQSPPEPDPSEHRNEQAYRDAADRAGWVIVTPKGERTYDVCPACVLSVVHPSQRTQP